MAQGGEVFVLEMIDSVRIADLARSMIRLSCLTGKTAAQPDGDIAIKATGLRPGETLFEELLIGDKVVPSSHPRIMSARERHIDPALQGKMLASLRQACDSNDVEAMLAGGDLRGQPHRPGHFVRALHQQVDVTTAQRVVQP